jgi:hypothetical protein
MEDVELAIDWMGFRIKEDLNLKEHCKSILYYSFYLKVVTVCKQLDIDPEKEISQT